MALRLRTLWLLLLAAVALPVQAFGASGLAVADPTQRALFDDLFREARGPQAAFARDLLPGRTTGLLAWYVRQLLVPFADNSAVAAFLPGYPIGADGSVQLAPVALGVAQGSGIAGAAVSPSGNACYLADGITNDLAAYTVDTATGLFSNVPGAPFATDVDPSGVVVEPSGRFLYAVNSTSQTVTAYAINLTTQALTKVYTMVTNASFPQAISANRQCVFVTGTGSGGYEVFAINTVTGALGSVPGSAFGTHQSSSVARTQDGNFVYFSAVSPAGEIEGFFVDPASCALSAVPGSPFTGPGGGILRVNPNLSVLYSAGNGSLQAYTIDPATGALSALGGPLSIDPATAAMVVSPKGEVLFLADRLNQNLRSVSLDRATGMPLAGGTPITGPSGVQSMALINQNGGEIIGQGIAQSRATRTYGGAPPYTVALIGGALPAGLALDPTTGLITGTATTLGQSSFDLRVTDAVGASVSGIRTLRVVAPPAAPAAPGNLAASATSPTQVTLTWQDNANQTAGFPIALSQDGGPFVAVQTENPQVTSAAVSGLSPATRYTFRISATNAGGGKADATTPTATTPALAPAACTAGANGQCLLGGRFLVEALYQDGHGNAGLANVVPITSDTAYLWFFSAENVEVVVKILDGCAIGGHYWVFAGGLTNVHVILRVTDTETGAVRYYEGPYGPAFTPLQDTAAFGTCPAKTATAADTEAARALRQQAVADIDARLAALAAARRPAQAVPAAGTGCTAGPTTLCLNNARFRVQATFDAGAAGSGMAQAVRLTADTGYLWFFSADNVEAIVKVLNGCGLNSRYWVFAGGLTNVKVTLTVTDTQAGQSWQYSNRANTVFAPIQDTSAFTTCP
jgi:6-phosphogluconolactonase